MRRGPAAATPPPMVPILRDVRRDRWQLGDLMATRLADVVPQVQRAVALATRVGHEVDERIDARGRHQHAMMPGMARLSTGLPTTFQTPTAHTLLAREAIGGRGF